MHAQPPREIECCAELGRSGRLTGSLRFPVFFKLIRDVCQRKLRPRTLSVFLPSLYIQESDRKGPELQRWLYVGAATQLKGFSGVIEPRADACSRNWARTLTGR